MDICNQTLAEVILEGPPEYKTYDLFIWETNPEIDETAQLRWVGTVSDCYFEYENFEVGFLFEEDQQIWLADVL